MKWLLVGLLLLTVALQYRLWVGDGGIREVLTLKRELAAMERSIQRMEDLNRQLEAEVKDLKNGLKAVEERARSELGMIKSDETFYQVITPGPDGGAPQ